MKISRVIVLPALVAIGILVCSNSFAKSYTTHRVNSYGKATRGSGDLVTQTRTTKEFQRIESSIAIDLKIEVGKPQSITLTFDDNLIDFIRTESDGRTLVIDSDESFSTQNGVEAVITVPNLDLIDSEGSGRIDVVNINTHLFRLIIAGSAEFTGTGKVERLDIEIDGSGDVRASQLMADEVTISINGSGSAEVHAVEVLDGEINGSGDITYIGKPESVHSSVNGSGTIRKKR